MSAILACYIVSDICQRSYAHAAILRFNLQRRDSFQSPFDFFVSSVTEGDFTSRQRVMFPT